MTTSETLQGLKDDMYAHDISVAGRMEAYQEETDFPIECFPAAMQRIVIGLRESMGFCIDYTALAAISVTSGAIGNSTRIQNFKNWTEPCILFSVIVGQPGANKSHPLSFMLEPLQELDAKYYKRYREDCEEYEKQLKMKATQKDTSEGEAIKRPVRRQIIASDVTIEALITMMDENPHGILLYSDEFSGFVENTDRYAHGSSEQAYLSLFNGKSISKNRKGENVSLRISNPFLCIVGTIQPDILTDLMEGKRKKNGFYERLLLAFPKAEVYPRWSELRKRDSDQYYMEWRSLVHSIFDEADRRMAEGTRIIALSDSACKVIDTWQDMNIGRIKNEKDNNIRDIYSKAAIYILRFCLIIQELDNACLGTSKQTVSPDVVERAIKLSEYFTNNSLRVIRYIHKNSLKEDEADVFKALPEEFQFNEGVRVATETTGNWYEKKFRRFLDRHKGMLFASISHGMYRKIL